MIKIYNYESWDEYEGASEGSGRSEKVWITKGKYYKKGVFKFPKVDSKDNTHSTEFISESLAGYIGKAINIPVAKTDIGIRDGKIGCLSHIFLSENETLIHGVDFITRLYPSFNTDLLFDPDSKKYYSFEMIYNSLGDIFKNSDFNIAISHILKIMIFDMLIGNTDRHQNNWGIVYNENTLEAQFSPLYDNGSSLCAYIKDVDIDKYCGKDIQKFTSLVDNKSTSRIRIDSYLRKEPKHSDVMRFVEENFKAQALHIIPTIDEKINHEWVSKTLAYYPDRLISPKKKELIKIFLLKKIEILKDIFY